MASNEPNTRSALVTGGSRGIGLAIARRLAAQGFALTIAGRDPDGLSEAAESLSAAGAPSVETVSADLAAEADVIRVADHQAERFDALDVLVLSAGVGTAGRLADYPARRVTKQLALNFQAPFLLTQRLLPQLRAAAAARPDTGAKIIAIGSLAGVVAVSDLAIYGATKAALISLCQSITSEEGANGVTATAICPGFVDTDMTAWAHDELKPSEMISAADIAELAMSVTRLSAHAAVPTIVVTRPGPQLWRA
jgi:short-subunit dehydrogenase